MAKVTESIRDFLQRRVSPVFLLLLFLSVILWYLTKLSYTYTAQIPVSVDIDGNKFKVTCVAEGTGYRIVSYRYFKANPIYLKFRDVQTTPSVINNGNYVINAYSLQNAISVRTSDLRIISIGELPEITISYER